MLIHNQIQLADRINIYLTLNIDFELFFRMDLNNFKIIHKYGTTFIVKEIYNRMIYQEQYIYFPFNFPIETHD